MNQSEFEAEVRKHFPGAQFNSPEFEHIRSTLSATLVNNNRFLIAVSFPKNLDEPQVFTCRAHDRNWDGRFFNPKECFLNSPCSSIHLAAAFSGLVRNLQDQAWDQRQAAETEFQNNSEEIQKLRESYQVSS